MPRSRKTTIPAKQRLAEILTFCDDTGVFRWKVRVGSKRVGDVAGAMDGGGYIRIKIDGIAYAAHHLAWLLVHGSYPARTVTHKNLCRSDNRPSNLQMLTDSRDTLTIDVLKSLMKYDPLTGVFTWSVSKGRLARRGDRVGHLDPTTGYIVIGINGEQYAAHRLAWFYVTENWPDQEIDHRSCNRSDNRFENLRPANDLEQARNAKRRKDNSSGFKGVSFHARVGKYSAYISANRKRTHLGYFDTAEAAATARAAVAGEKHGLFARAA